MRRVCCVPPHVFFAGVMELADVLDSKSSGGDTVPVRPRPPAPSAQNPNQLPIVLVGEGFGFVVRFCKVVPYKTDRSGF